MDLTPLNYAPPGVRWPRRRAWGALSIIAALLLVALALPIVPVRQVESRMDPVTGSLTWKTAWVFGVTSGPRVDISPLETRLKSSGIPWTRSWQLLHNTHRNILGNPTCFECGSAPPIYQILPALKGFAAAATDSELREFVRVMQSGTDPQKQAAIDEVGEKGLKALAADPPGG